MATFHRNPGESKALPFLTVQVRILAKVIDRGRHRGRPYPVSRVCFGAHFALRTTFLGAVGLTVALGPQPALAATGGMISALVPAQGSVLTRSNSPSGVPLSSDRGRLAAPPRPGTITLSDALERALADNPEVRSAEIQLDEAKAEQGSAAAYYWKALSANIGVMPPLLGAGTWNGTGGFVLNLNLGDLLVNGPLGKRQAATQVELARQALRRAKLQVVAEVTAAHAAFEASTEVEDLRSQAEHAADLDRQATEREFAGGRATGTDLRRARLAWSQAAVDLASARSEVTKTWSALLAAIGDGTALRQASAAAGSGNPMPAGSVAERAGGAGQHEPAGAALPETGGPR